jgi:ubiquinone/menaquinone biosynthesis C-methylase UbiE
VADRWAEWLRVRRTGGSEDERRATLERLAPVRDRVLDDAHIRPGDVLLDVGCGDGLIGLGALDRGARVIFSDVSAELLDDCRAIAGDEAEYRVADVTDLGDLEADVVTTRSVLIYVPDKAQAFRELFRVLRPGGRLSIFEPINRFGLEERSGTYGFEDVTGVEELVARVVARMAAGEQQGGLAGMVDFDERDLLTHAEAAGFVDIRLTLLAEITTESMIETRDWDIFLRSAPNPLAPTFGEAMDAALAPEERDRLTAVLRPQVEHGRGRTRIGRAYLNARKP